MLRWRDGGKMQQRSKILQQKGKVSCASLSRKSFYFSVQRVAYFAGSACFPFPTWQPLAPFVLLLPFPPCKLLPPSRCIRGPACTPFPAFPSLQLSLLFSPGSVAVNKPVGDHLVPVWTQSLCSGGKQLDGCEHQTFHSTWPLNRGTSRACFIRSHW